MSNDLISRSAVLKIIEDIKRNNNVPKNYGTLLGIMREIRELPTAYDVDKVVEQISDIHFEFQEVSSDKYKVLKIVKAGGVNE